MIFHNSRRESGSTPTVGSSSSNNSGERTSVQASPSFCFMPPDNRPASRSVNGRQRRHLHQPRIALAPLGGRDAVQIGVEIQVLLHGQILVQPESLRHVADAGLHLLRIGGGVDAQHFQFAAVGGHQPGGQPISVVLPAPSGPTSAVSVPSAAANEMPSSAGTISPVSRRNVLRRSRAQRTGGLSSAVSHGRFLSEQFLAGGAAVALFLAPRPSPLAPLLIGK